MTDPLPPYSADAPILCPHCGGPVKVEGDNDCGATPTIECASCTAVWNDQGQPLPSPHSTPAG